MLARRGGSKWDRLPGRPPGRADQHLGFPHVPDSLVLWVLWIVVAAGLLALGALALSLLLGRATAL